ncbi:MAG TPA: tRNA (adenosine(37)-N6)-threonylcarbamoyltransferase complex transferase subunit TsaD [Polyangiaceae bacterium]|nr:tRNA (adenosine(37)-N6)-threonylcarbamoyltransferase complex transferase subunit TsaD [Polyangiaceae bacterium]
MLTLGIESSCDETAAAVVDETGFVHSDVVRSQVALHAPYGGIVPELASRDHVRGITLVIREAMTSAAVDFDALQGVAVTARPGLSGALLVGVQVAKGIAWARELPIVAVDHLVGHLLAVFLRRRDPRTASTGANTGASEAITERLVYPFVALLASGGHTAIYRVNGPQVDAIHELGATRDDAAGEAFDKVAKVIGLGYPGGPLVDRLAAQGNADRFPIPPPMARRDSLEFSFSGVKSFVARHVAEHGKPTTDAALADLCAGFQRTVVDSLVSKTVRAARAEHVTSVVLAGGVAANRELRRRAAEACAAEGLALHVPPMASCTDNAAMIAYAGALRLDRGERDDLSFATATRTALPRVTRKGGGRRAASR